MKCFNTCLVAILLFAAVNMGQSKNVLADGSTPLTQTMVSRFIGLMEWSLDSTFADEDRIALKNQVVAYWKNGDEKSVKSVLEMLTFEQKLSGAAEDQKRNLQPQIQRKLLEEFEKDSSEPLNKILLAVYNKNHSSNSDSIAESQGGGSLSELVGRWQVSHMNSVTTQNVYSGAIGGGNGMIAEYDIKPDGRVIFSFYLTQNTPGCSTKIKTSKIGLAVVNGSRVTFTYGSGTTISEDSCNRKNNYTKDLGKTSETFDFNVKRVSGKTQFCFADAKLKDCAVKLD